MYINECVFISVGLHTYIHTSFERSITWDDYIWPGSISILTSSVSLDQIDLIQTAESFCIRFFFLINRIFRDLKFCHCRPKISVLRHQIWILQHLIAREKWIGSSLLFTFHISSGWLLHCGGRGPSELSVS